MAYFFFWQLFFISINVKMSCGTPIHLKSAQMWINLKLWSLLFWDTSGIIKSRWQLAANFEHSLSLILWCQILGFKCIILGTWMGGELVCHKFVMKEHYCPSIITVTDIKTLSNKTLSQHDKPILYLKFNLQIRKIKKRNSPHSNLPSESSSVVKFPFQFFVSWYMLSFRKLNYFNNVDLFSKNKSISLEGRFVFEKSKLGIKIRKEENEMIRDEVISK